MRAEQANSMKSNTDYEVNGYRFSKVCVHNGKMELMDNPGVEIIIFIHSF